ncbi:MAG TPA: hypothetical protein VGO80_09580 [Solirubrobacteraceae bacterium]|nr:hypothetical protein [Solirubrobacteraceae bacterium]
MGFAEPVRWTRRTADALVEVLQEAREGMFDRPAGSALVRLLTLAGRVRFEDAAAGLRPWEDAVLGEALTAETLRLRPPDEPLPLHGDSVIVVQSRLGRLTLHPVAEQPDPDGVRLARLELPSEVAERARESAEEAELLETAARQPFDRMLADLAAQGRLADVVRDVADRVDHVESVYVYVGRHLFARSDVGNTLLRGGELLSLAQLPLGEWTPDERIFVAAFHLLFMTGRSIRIEEFNGRQLSARSTRAWLERKHQLYSARLGLPYEPHHDLTELARRSGELRLRLEPGGAVGFRRVNGLTLGKRERVGQLAELDPLPDELSPLLCAFAGSHSVSDRGAPTEVIALLAKMALREKADDPDSTLVERLLERIVLSAVCECGADYGMSSSICDLDRLIPEADDRCAGVLDLVKQDFFCVSVPHPELVERLDEDTLSEVLQAVASRMRFNRWHFIAGNFERAEIPAKRHYFFPPLMPDIAQWSDLRHPGHTNSSVRHTIRAPGPALWRPPLRVFGNDYRGFFDIRLVRMSGQPFTLRELQIACRHCALVDAFWREGARMAEEGASPSPTVTAFTAAYWTGKAWSDAVAEAAALQGGRVHAAASLVHGAP